MASIAPATTPRGIADQAAGALSRSRSPRSLWSNARRQFRRNKMAMTGLFYLLFLAVVAAAAPAISTQNPIEGDLRAAGEFCQAAWIDDENAKRSGSWDYPLGTDGIGRDVFSCFVYGTPGSL